MSKCGFYSHRLRGLRKILWWGVRAGRLVERAAGWCKARVTRGEGITPAALAQRPSFLATNSLTNAGLALPPLALMT